jgi:hypothetical protein
MNWQMLALPAINGLSTFSSRMHSDVNRNWCCVVLVLATSCSGHRSHPNCWIRSLGLLTSNPHSQLATTIRPWHGPYDRLQSRRDLFSFLMGGKRTCRKRADLPQTGYCILLEPRDSISGMHAKLARTAKGLNALCMQI